MVPEYERLQEALLQLKDKVERLETKLEKAGSVTHYHINELHMHDPIVKELAFQLEGIHIHELSGELNLGNNFALADKNKSRNKPTSRTSEGAASPTPPAPRTRPPWQSVGRPVRLVLTDEGLVHKKT